MRQKTKRLLSGLLIAAMLSTALPVTAMAADNVPAEEKSDLETTVSQEETSENVQAFLDAVAAIPEEINADNASEVYGLAAVTCVNAYEALTEEERALEAVQAAHLLLEQAIERVNALSEPAATSDGDAVRYKDGTYTGSGTGFGGTITLDVTIRDGRLESIEEVSQSETTAYWNSAKALFDTILTAQSTNVDAVTGATYSSNGIKAAVDDALTQAAAAANDEDDTAVFSSGSGTEKDPYVIKTAAQLANFAQSVDDGETYAGQYVALGDNIDLTGIENWNPIGSETNTTAAFAGDFDGRGYTIDGMTIDMTLESATSTTYTYAGLFATLGGTAAVRNVTLTNVGIRVTDTGSGRVLAAAVAGYTSKASTAQYLYIQNCHADGTIRVDAAGMAYGGGILGQAGMYAAILNCTTDITVSAKSSGSASYAAGIVAVAGNNGMVVNCAALGDVSAVSTTKGSGTAAGIAGLMPGKLYNCYASGSITAGNTTGAVTGVGALVGMATMTDSEAGALRAYNYYATDAVLTVSTYSGGELSAETTTTTVDCGQAMGSPMVSKAVSLADMKTSEFMDTLNENLYAVQKLMNAYSLPSVTLNNWILENGTVQPAGEAWASDRVDADIFASGTGTQDDPYLIKTAEQMRAFAVSLTDNLDYTGIYIALADDIDISGSNWIPVGQSYDIFNGSFDGQGHTISGLTEGSADAPLALDETNIYIGLFGVVGPECTIKNLKLTDVSMYLTYEATAYAGGIAAVTSSGSTGYLGAVIDNCSVSGTISLTSSGNNFVGGIVGMQIRGAIINCATDMALSCTVNNSYIAEVGGLVGLNNRGLIANSYALGDVYGSGSRENGNEGMAAISALVGVQAGALVNCYGAGGHTTKEYSQYVGAVSGWVTGIGKSYTCWYNGDAPMLIGTQTVLPVESIGTKVTSGVNEDGDQYTGGIVDALTAYTADTYEAVAAGLNGSFAAFPIDITAYGVDTGALRTWCYADGVVTFGDDYATVTYQQPDCEIVPVTEKTLRDGVWYGRSADKTSIVKITVENGTLTDTEILSGEAEGDSYDEAVSKAAEKSLYGDTTTYFAADPVRFAGGEGTEASPYLISNEEQLRYLAESINEDVDWENVWFYLTADIDVSSREWLPIGWAVKAEIGGRAVVYSAYPFRGNFDGGDHTISGLTIGSEAEPTEWYTAGLFGIVEGEYADNYVPSHGERAVILRNIHLSDVAIHVTHRYDTYVGGLAGCGQDGIIIDNCSVTGTITSLTQESASRAAGLLSYAIYGSITNCWTDVALDASTVDGSTYGGGMFASTNRVTVINCYALGDVTSDAGNNNKIHIGGFSGMDGGICINCYAAGSVIAEKPTTDVGGLSGRLTGIGVNYNCYYDTEAVQRNGATTNTENVAFGVVVEGALNVTAGKTGAELASSDFAALLNENQTGMTEVLAEIQEHLDGLTLIHSIYSDGTGLLEWTLSDGVVGFAARSAAAAEVDGVGYDTLQEAVDAVASNGTITLLAAGQSAVVAEAKRFTIVSANGYTAAITAASGYKLQSAVDNSADTGASWTYQVVKETGSSIGGGSSGGYAVSVPDTALAFADVPSDRYYYDAVIWAVENGITNGTAPGVFSPNASCTRAQTITFLWRAAGSPAPERRDNPFIDVPSDAYYCEAVLWAVEQGITNGTTKTTFSPNAAVTRAQSVTFLYRAAEATASGRNPFTDVADSAYYADAVSWAAAEGITSGTTATTFRPAQACTRAQIVTFLYRAAQ